MRTPTLVSEIAPASSQERDAGAGIWRQLLQFYQYKWLILGAIGLGLGVAYFWTERLPRAYQADCTIEYDPNPMRPLGRDIDDTASGTYHYWTSREFFATQNRILTSRVLAERVVRKLGLHQDPAFMGVSPEHRAEWKGGDMVAAATMLQKRISVEQERDTRIVHIRVTDGDPERAMVLANTVADAYMEKVMQDRLGSTSGALQWLGEQLDSLKGQLERSELSLHEFVQDEANLATPFEDQQHLISKDIERFNDRLSEARVERVELAARLKALEEANRTDPLAVQPAMVSGGSATASEELRVKYFDIARERDALALKYGDQHPQLRALNQELEGISEQVRRELDSFITSARAQLDEVQDVEAGVHALLQKSNRAGLALNLQEITYRRLQRERDNAARLYGSILERTAETDLSHALQVSFVRLVDRALKPTFSVYPSYRKSLTVGALLGLVLGIALAFLLGQLDRVIRSVEDAEALGLTILGILPRIEESGSLSGSVYARRKRKKDSPELVANRDLVVHTHPQSTVAECCRTIRTNLTFMAADRPHRAVVITSASPREGKTTVAMSIAISLAQSGKRVLLVDTDLRKPRMHKALGRSKGRGVTTVLVGEHTTKEAIQSTEIPGLDLLASGPVPPNPSELLHTVLFGELVAELSRRYDHVLFDSPPLAAVTDAAVIAPQVDGVILVVHGQKTTRDALRSALRQLRDVNAHITGGVLNDVDSSSRQYGYGSYYYRSEGYYEAEEEPAAKADVPAAES